jgi:hypothetical protein
MSPPVKETWYVKSHLQGLPENLRQVRYIAPLIARFVKSSTDFNLDYQVLITVKYVTSHIGRKLVKWATLNFEKKSLIGYIFILLILLLYHYNMKVLRQFCYFYQSGTQVY